MSTDLQSNLPINFRGPSTTITRIAAGLSGAAVYRVDAAGEVFVLKVSELEEPLDSWRRKLGVQQLAADAGLAPRIVHTDEARRAILSAFIVDRSFFAFYGTPETRDAAFILLVRTIRRTHELPLPANATWRDPREFLDDLWSNALANFPVPAFVSSAVQRLLAEEPPPRERPMVLSHNDLNPTNFVYDGEKIVFLDWNTAGPNDLYFDLATIAVFLRMDEHTCKQMLATYDNEPAAALPARFSYSRRLVAVMCGASFLRLAREGGHAGATGQETLDTAPSLGEVYQRLRAGSLNVATGDGQWLFALGLISTASESVRSS